MSVLLFLRAFLGSTLCFTSGEQGALLSWSLLTPMFLVLLLFSSRGEVEELKVHLHWCIYPSNNMENVDFLKIYGDIR